MPLDPKVKEALEAIDGGDVLYQNVLDSIDAEKTKGIQIANKANSEAHKFRKYKSTVESLGFNPEEADLDSWSSNIKETISNSTEYQQKLKELPAKNKELDELKTTVNNLNSKLIEKENAVLASRLGKRLGENLYSADLHAKDLVNSKKVKLGDDGESIFFVNGDEEIDFDTGITDYIEKHSSDKRNTQRSGSGSSSDGEGDEGNNKPDDMETRRKKLRQMRSGTIY